MDPVGSLKRCISLYFNIFALEVQDQTKNGLLDDPWSKDSRSYQWAMFFFWLDGQLVLCAGDLFSLPGKSEDPPLPSGNGGGKPGDGSWMAALRISRFCPPTFVMLQYCFDAGKILKLTTY